MFTVTRRGRATVRRARAAALTPVLGLVAAGIPVPSPAQFAASEEYAMIGYEREATANPVARMQAALESGELELEFGDRRGYFDALLEALDIDADSQTLVFSATSLQHDLISATTPRALYFNDDTYLGFVQKSEIVEVATIDEDLGIVFYTFDNAPGTTKYFERANQPCLVCHDTQGTTGGGVPMLMALSSVYTDRGVPLKKFSGMGNVGDQTPIADRWGGWYVTGRHGVQAHLGNLMLESAAALEQLDDHRVWNVDSLAAAGYLDTDPYLRDSSDIVALMVLEHQITVQNQLSYVRFKAPAVLRRRGLDEALAAPSWDALPTPAQAMLTPMLDKLVGRLVFLDAADSASRLSGSQSFVEDFEARGPHDDSGRSLRELDDGRRLFRYPLSFLIHSDDFAALPPYARDYVYRRLAEYLGGQGSLEGRTQYSRAERRVALEILTATEPAFRPYSSRN